MFETHYPALIGAYSLVLIGWLVAKQLARDVWPACEETKFARPWRELAFVILAIVLVLAVGQLYSRGIRLPERGPLQPIAGSLNQFLIFAPLLLLLPLRHQPWCSAWISTRKLGWRLLAGVILAAVALVAYSSLRKGAGHPGQLLGRIARYENLAALVQVFLEDIAIAILFVRFTAAVGAKWSLLIVAVLFAAGHIPAMIAHGASTDEFLRLLCDAGLGVAVLWILRQSRDIVWLVPIHFCMDMTQFDRVAFGQ